MKKTLIIIASVMLFIAASCGSRPSSGNYMVVGYVAGFGNFNFSAIDAAVCAGAS